MTALGRREQFASPTSVLLLGHLKLRLKSSKLQFFREVMKQLRQRGATDIPLFGGGGGTITPADERAMLRAGVRFVMIPEVLSDGYPSSER